MTNKLKTPGIASASIICTREEAIKKGIEPFCACPWCQEKKKAEEKNKNSEEAKNE